MSRRWPHEASEGPREKTRACRFVPPNLTSGGECRNPAPRDGTYRSITVVLQPTAGGLDVGVAALCALADTQGDRRHLENARPRKHLAERLAAAQADRAKKKRGSLGHRAAGRRVARIKAKERRVRADALHKVSAALVAGYDCIFVEIFVEDLRVASMVRSARGTSGRTGQPGGVHLQAVRPRRPRDLHAAANVSRAGLALREAGHPPNEKQRSACALRAG